MYLQGLSFSSIPHGKYGMKHGLAGQRTSTGAEHTALTSNLSLLFIVKLYLELWSSLFQQGFAKRPHAKLQICANTVDNNIRLQQNSNKNTCSQTSSKNMHRD